MKTLFIVLMLSIVLLATGCPKNSPKMTKLFDKFTERSATFVTKFDNQLKRYDCLMEGRDWDGTACSGTFYPPSDLDKVQAKLVRDAVLYELLYVTDENYAQFESDLYARRATSSFLADFVETGANLAGNITNGVRAKNIIFASIAAFRTNRKSYDLRFFQEQTTNVLVLKMQTSRNRVLKDIVVQRARSVDDYPMEAALGDAIKYFFAGTLPRAFQELQQDTSVQAKEAADQLLLFKGIPIGKPATVEQKDLALAANDGLNKLGGAATSGTQAEQTAALAKLQKILQDIEADAALVTAINGNAVVAAHLAAARANRANGVSLYTELKGLKREAYQKINDESVAKINKIIADNTKE